MKHFNKLYILGLLLVPLSLSGQENILTSRVLREPVQNVSEVNDANSITTIEYYDTAGRLVQTVQKGFGPNGEDLADYTQFDEAGRKEKEYLFTPFSGNGGAFIPFSQFEQNSQTWSHAYQYEASTEGRVIEASGMHIGGKSVKYDYRLSNSSEPELSAFEFRMQNNTTLNKRTAVRGAYQVTEETDEDGHRTLLFTDSDGHTVLKRRIDGAIYHDTYMIYDAYDHLRCVLPPAAVDAYSSFDNQRLSVGNFLDLYAYFYIYDNDNQCIGVKYPGADWIYTVYDGDYRPILSQDGNQRKRDEWSFIKYDGLGRVVIEGIVKDKRSRDDLAAVYNNVLVLEDFIGSGGSCRGYTDHVKMGQSSYTLINVRYYDNYTFTGLSSDWSFAGRIPSASAQGLLTGIFEAVLNQTEKGRYTVNQYDDKSRLIRCRTKETLSNNTLSASYSYNFSGALTRSDSRYDNRYSLRLNYNYDHAGREKNSIYALGYKTTHYTSSLRAFTYDSYGRVSEKQLQGNKVKMTYGYHNDGTLFNIGSMNGFNETLYFGDSMLPYQLPRCNNGNIADISISQGGRLYFYHFDYDGFDRLTSGMMYGVNGSRMRNDEFFDYDKMGNVTFLSRLKDSGSVNDLDIHYRGNQLLKVTDGNHSFPATYNFAIYPDLADNEQEYYYDSNGNETANLDKNIVATRYNILNLPDTVQFGNGNRIVNYYLPSGTKLGSISRTYTTPLSVPLDKVAHSTDPYVETKEWCNEEMHYKNDIAERVDIEDGYLQLNVNKTSGALNSIGYYAYICDHLGSVRQVCDAVTGNVVQSLEYYPSGLIFRSTNYDLQSNKYTGKELISMHGLNQYDSDARMQEFQIPHFTTRDLLCEKYYDLSPYVYCANNSIRFIDQTGTKFTEAAWKHVYNLINDINKRQVKNNNSIAEKQAKINTGGLSDKKVIKLQKQINKLKNNSSDLEVVREEIAILESSDQIYDIRSDNSMNVEGAIPGTGEYRSSAAFNFENNNFEIVLGNGSLNTLAHELKHAYQFETGTFSSGYIYDGSPFYDKSDEWAAYSRGTLFGGARVYTLPAIYDNLQNGPMDVTKLAPIILNSPKQLQKIANRTKSAFRVNGVTYVMNGGR